MWITRCPGCGTCFRVGEAQLAVARGLVRCGACLQVFAALDYLLDPDAEQHSEPANDRYAGEDATWEAPDAAPETEESTSEEPEVAPEMEESTSEAPEVAPEMEDSTSEALEVAGDEKDSTSEEPEEAHHQGSSAWYESDAAAEPEPCAEDDIGGIEEDSEDDRDPARVPESNPELEMASDPHVADDAAEMEMDRHADWDPAFVPEQEPELGVAPGPRMEDEEAAIEEDREPVWDSAWIPELEPDFGMAPEPHVEDDVSDVEQDRDAEWDAVWFPGPEPEAEMAPAHRGAEDDDTEIEEDREAERDSEWAPESELEPASEPYVVSDRALAPVEELSAWRAEQDAAAEAEADEVPELTRSVDASELTEEERRKLTDALAFQPIDAIETFPERRSVVEWSGWILLNLVMIAMLALQYAWFHRNVLSERDALRGWYELACANVTCELPDFVDFERLEARNLVVRSHPRVPGALVVDAILYNSSAYAQPFPMLDLSFTDIDNKHVAARRFRPDEYLHGEVASYRKIPGHTEVRLSLEIVDPGESAVSYQLEVVRI